LSVVIGVVSLSNHTVRLSLRPSTGRPSTGSGQQAPFDRLPSTSLPSTSLPSTGSLRQAQGGSTLPTTDYQLTDFPANCPSTSSLRQASLRQAQGGSHTGREGSLSVVIGVVSLSNHTVRLFLRPSTSRPSTGSGQQPPFDKPPFDKLPSTSSGRQHSPDSRLPT
jgi:hypothetical protein